MRNGTLKLFLVSLLLVFAGGVVGCASKQSSSALVDHEIASALVEAELKKQKQQPSGGAFEEATIQKTTETYALRSTTDVIWPGMEFTLEVVEDQELNGTYSVQFDGKVELPYDRTIDTTGLTKGQLEQRIASTYRTFFRTPPTIAVRVTDQSQLVEVQGLVSEPGQVKVQKNSSLDQLIAAAGGLLRGDSQKSQAKFVLVEQSGSARVIKLSDYYAGVAEPITGWRGGDRVFFQSEAQGEHAEMVEQRDALQIIGQVHTPGEYPLYDGKGVFHYLAQAGGPTEQADFKRVELVRVTQGVKSSETFSLTEKGKLPELQSGDILLFHARKDSKAVGNVTSVINSLATALLAAFAI